MNRNKQLLAVLIFTLLACFASDAQAVYHPKLGRWMQQDPLGRDTTMQQRLGTSAMPSDAFAPTAPTPTPGAGYHDGMNLYEYVGSRIGNAVDADGLLIWNVAATQSIVGKGLQVKSRGFITWPKTTPPTALAVAIPRLEIRFECKCSWARHSLSGQVTGKFWVEVRYKAAYASPAQSAWVRRAEGDHVADFQAWARGNGRAAAVKAENEFKSKWYWTANSCGTSGYKIFRKHIQPSIARAIKQTTARHDTTKRHTWGHANQRP